MENDENPKKKKYDNPPVQNQSKEALEKDVSEPGADTPLLECTAEAIFGNEVVH